MVVQLDEKVAFNTLSAKFASVFDHLVGLAHNRLKSDKTDGFSHWNLLINLLFKKFNAPKLVYRREVSIESTFSTENFYF